MASVAASGIFNALAFASAGCFFKLVDKNNYEVEIKSRNLDMEKLARTKEMWYENLVAHKNKIAELRTQPLSDANTDLNTTNKALDNLRKIMSVLCDNKKFTQEPWKEDFYKPSKEMVEYEHATVGVTRLVCGLVCGYVL